MQVQLQQMLKGLFLRTFSPSLDRTLSPSCLCGKVGLASARIIVAVGIVGLCGRAGTLWRRMSASVFVSCG